MRYIGDDNINLRRDAAKVGFREAYLIEVGSASLIDVMETGRLKKNKHHFSFTSSKGIAQNRLIMREFVIHFLPWKKGCAITGDRKRGGEHMRRSLLSLTALRTVLLDPSTILCF
jgi:hypothetical protein